MLGKFYSEKTGLEKVIGNSVTVHDLNDCSKKSWEMSFTDVHKFYRKKTTGFEFRTQWPPDDEATVFGPRYRSSFFNKIWARL